MVFWSYTGFYEDGISCNRMLNQESYIPFSTYRTKLSLKGDNILDAYKKRRNYWLRPSFV
jgi:hypothetical protein